MADADVTPAPIAISKARRRFIRVAKLTLVLAYLVITAGAVVRATGSGMGCPDWPRCFGHYIPPTQLEQLEFGPGKTFKKGQFIIWERALWKARKTFTTSAEWQPGDWEKYTKHDYARFNPMHTWTEYLNRLMGALLGFASIGMVLTALGVRKEAPRLVWLSLSVLFLVGFEGWLGATVVASNLMPAKITTHMIVALVIIALLIFTIYQARRGGAAVRMAPAVKAALATVLVLTLAQIVLGTQVRENVDELDKMYSGNMRTEWVAQLGQMFHVHRVFAYVVILANLAFVYLLWKSSRLWRAVAAPAVAVLVLLLVEWISGVSLALYSLPAAIQPVHLVVATIIFGVQTTIWARLRRPVSALPPVS